MDLNVGGDFDERHGDRRAECQGGPEGRAWGRAIWGVASILQRYIVWVPGRPVTRVLRSNAISVRNRAHPVENQSWIRRISTDLHDLEPIWGFSRSSPPAARL